MQWPKEKGETDLQNTTQKPNDRRSTYVLTVLLSLQTQWYVINYDKRSIAVATCDTDIP